MEEILQRLLEVEREGERLVKAAETQAEELTATARREATELRQRLQQELIEAADAMVRERTAAAEEQRRQKLERRMTELEATIANLQARQPDAIDVVTAQLLEV